MKYNFKDSYWPVRIITLKSLAEKLLTPGQRHARILISSRVIICLSNVKELTVRQIIRKHIDYKAHSRERPLKVIKISVYIDSIYCYNRLPLFIVEFVSQSSVSKFVVSKVEFTTQTSKGYLIKNSGTFLIYIN